MSDNQVSDVLARAFAAEGTDILFTLMGDANMYWSAAMADSQGTRLVHARHEHCAVAMADGYARATGKVGVAMATSGPGATNLVTPVADAFLDSTPLVIVTGQVPSHLIGTDAFQEADISRITMACTKHNFLVTDPIDIPRMLAEAFHLASTGRPGAVLVDIPKDVLQAQTTFSWPPEMKLLTQVSRYWVSNVLPIACRMACRSAEEPPRKKRPPVAFAI